jgi:hypothetical protein
MANSSTTLASLTPFYAPGSHSTKVHMGRLVEWVMESVALQEEDAGFGATISPSKQPNSIEYLSFLNKCVITRDPENFVEGRDVRIFACEETYIYLGSMVDCL